MLVLAVLVAVVALLCWLVVWGGDQLLRRLSSGRGQQADDVVPPTPAAAEPPSPAPRRRRRPDASSGTPAGPPARSATPPASGSRRASASAPEPAPAAAPQLQALDPAVRDTYQQSWQRTLQRFQEDPQPALVAAEQLVTLLLDERGYPTEGPGRVSETSGDPAGVLPDYLAAHQVVSSTEPSSSDMRKAMDALSRTVSALLDDRPRAPQR